MFKYIKYIAMHLLFKRYEDSTVYDMEKFEDELIDLERTLLRRYKMQQTPSERNINCMQLNRYSSKLYNQSI